jgi:phosphatidylglycerophosphatase C
VTHIAIFDVDGTLTPRNTLPALVRHALRRRPWRAGYVLVVLPLVAIGLFTDTGRAKERLLSAVVRGMTEDEVCLLGAAVATRARLSSDVEERLQGHRARGDDVWLASASVEPVIAALAARVGAAGHVATRLEYRQGVCTGRFLGENCKGGEKLRRLNEVLAKDWQSVATAYSDSTSDRPVMEAAAEHRWVRRGALR